MNTNYFPEKQELTEAYKEDIAKSEEYQKQAAETSKALVDLPLVPPDVLPGVVKALEARVAELEGIIKTLVAKYFGTHL